MPKKRRSPTSRNTHQAVEWCYDGPKPKKKFHSYDEAALVLVDAKITRFLTNGNTKRHEERIYYHHACNAHHLTSKPEGAS